MPRTRDCDFCGADIEPGTGTMLVLNDGTTHHFCSAKCEKNVDLGREARNLEWTESGGRRRRPATEEPAETEEVESEETEPDAEAEDAEDSEADAEAETEDDDADEETEAVEADETEDDEE